MSIEVSPELLKKITPEFLETLLEVATAYGWSGDLVEIEKFVGQVFETAGKDKPDIPY